MFGNKTFSENKERVVEVDDVSLEVVDQFLTFLYTGQLKDNRVERTGNNPTWIELLPQLVYVGDKVTIE